MGVLGLQSSGTWDSGVFIHIYMHTHIYIDVCKIYVDMIHVCVYTCTYVFTYVYIYILCLYARPPPKSTAAVFGRLR